MDVSVIIATRNQKERLRLVLCGLECQTFAKDRFEIVVVDDGCTDGTLEMVDEVVGKGLANARVLTDAPHGGRNATRNRGVAAAEGELAVFLDGDALPAPHLLQQYWDAHELHGERAVLCGEQYCLPDVEYFQDPQTGSLVRDVPMASVLKDFLAARCEEFAVTENTVRSDFAAIEERSQLGGYPQELSRKRQEQVKTVLEERPQTRIAWIALIPHNCAIPRRLLQLAGGFDEEISFHEGWELAYRLQRHEGAPIHRVDASTYHLYHYHPFAEPEAMGREREVRQRAVQYMAQKHEDSRVQLVHFWLGFLQHDPLIPEESLIVDLIELDRQYEELPEAVWREYEIILGNHPSRFPLALLEEQS